MLADSSGLLFLFLKHAVSSIHCLMPTGPPGRHSLLAHQEGDKQEASTDQPAHSTDCAVLHACPGFSGTVSQRGCAGNTWRPPKCSKVQSVSSEAALGTELRH